MIQSKVLENLEIKNLNHLGIIAGIIDEIGLVEIINKQADSALYSQNNLKLMKGMSWVTRVPLSIKEAKEIVSKLAKEEFNKSEIPGYLY